MIHYIIDRLKNRTAVDLSPCKQKRDFIYIDDVIKAYSLLIKDPSSAVGFCIHCAFHFPILSEALTDSNSSNFQYPGQTALPLGKIAGNSMISHLSDFNSFWDFINI